MGFLAQQHPVVNIFGPFLRASGKYLGCFFMPRRFSSGLLGGPQIEADLNVRLYFNIYILKFL